MKKSIKGVVQTTVRSGLSLLFTGALVLGAPTARAAHTNYAHADLCSTSANAVVFDDAGLVNNSTTSAAFYCPVINADPATMNNASGRVRGWDGNSGGWAFVCRGVLRNSSSQTVVFAGDAQGPITPGYTGPVNIPQGGSNGTLNFPVPVTSNDSLVIACDVPPSSGIYNVRVDN